MSLKSFHSNVTETLQLCLLQSDKLELFHKIFLSLTKEKKKKFYLVDFNQYPKSQSNWCQWTLWYSCTHLKEQLLKK